ncbi:MAG: helix-turn-helix transcriptional regulator [Nitrospirae bacterium]|nr:helix-turn-helix transcriptional regulator [Nitrospirota bacterium]
MLDYGSAKVSPKIRLAMVYLHDHHHLPLDLGQVGRHVALHPKYLSTRFKLECGVGFKAYLDSVRLQQASELLKDPTKSIKMVGARVGFSSQGRFCKVFKKYFKISPRQYRGSLI